MDIYGVPVHQAIMLIFAVVCVIADIRERIWKR